MTPESLRTLSRRLVRMGGCCLAFAIAAGAPRIHAESFYRCVGTDGTTAYSTKRIKDATCTVRHVDSGRVSGPSRLPNAPDAPAARRRSDVAPRNGTAETETAAPVPLATDARHPAVDVHPALKDFGDPNATAVLSPLRQGSGSFRYVQIGDSHTAGDFMTEQLRTRLQARLGDGGIGWAMPMRVPGQRLARVSFEHDGWELSSSRTSGIADYPFGGLIAQVTSDSTTLTVTAKQGSVPQHITVMLRQGPLDAPLLVSDAVGRQQRLRSPSADGRWHAVAFDAWLPLTVTAQRSRGTAIGGWWLRGTGAGAVVSAVGINGSELTHLGRWRGDWMDDLDAAQPDLIALAYGTNEAFDATLDQTAARQALETSVDQLRRHFPKASILILGAPESLSAVVGSCGRRAPSLDAVQRIQRDVASRKKTLFWDWQQAMGGACSMRRWVSQDLARSDGVHFSAVGYARLGDSLYQGLIDAAARSATGGGPGR